MADLRTRNNISSKKSYEKSLEQKYANDYEHEMVRHYILTNPGTDAYHWSVVPEDYLYEAGYINDFNKQRLERLMIKKEKEEGKNRLKDYGFDGLARARVGDTIVFNGLQAKYYFNKQVSSNDIGTFLAMQNALKLKNPLSKGLLYTTSSLQADLAGLVANPSYPIKHVLHPWKHPDARTIPKDVHVQFECDKKLRSDQVDALKQLEDKDGINALEIPCRWGKSMVAGHHTKRINANLIVAIAPLLVSVENLQDRLTCFLPEYLSLLVDSDTGGTTNIEEITKFLASKRKHIIYSTFKSAVDILSKLLTDYEDAYILCDEIHNANPQLCEFVQQFPKGLVMSATMPEEIVNLLDINHTVYIPFAQAIKDGIVVDYTLWLPYLTKASDGTTSVDIEIPVEFSTYDSDLTAKAFYLATVMLKTGSRRCITYLGRQEECDQFIEVVKQIFEIYHGLTIWTGKIDSTVSKEKRKEILEAFQIGQDDVYRILTSVRILDEAVDIPRCDSVFITNAGEHSSDIRMMQRSQRSSTKDPKNPSKHNNIILWADGWEKCVGALDLLREADPEFHKKVRIADCKYDRSGEITRIESVKEEEIEFAKWEEMRCVSLWDRNLKRINEIKVFRETYHTFPKCKGKRDNGHEAILSTFIMTVRENKRCRRLNINLEKKILELIPDFIWNIFDENHSNKIRQVKEFYTTYSEKPKHNGTRENERTLANYMTCRKREYKEGKLKKPVIDLINESWNPWFTWEDTHHEDMIRACCEFVEKYKESPKSTGKRGNEGQLYRYISHRREDKKAGKLSLELEKEIMDNCSTWWVWDIINDIYIINIEKLEKFYTTFHEPPKIDGKRTNDENKLARCLGTWRQNKIKNIFPIQYETLIQEKLPWMSRDLLYDRHVEKITAIKNFYNKYTEPPKSTGLRDEGNEKKLSSYMLKRREDYKKGDLSQTYITLIESEWTPWFVWDSPFTEKNVTKINQIKAFMDTYHCLPSSKGTRDDGNESVLGKGLVRIRLSKKNNSLPESIIKLVEDKLSPLFSWDPKIEDRNTLLANISRFYAKYKEEPKQNGTREDGHEAKMAAYLSQRRNNKKKGKLNEEIKKQINKALPWFNWDTLYTHELPTVRNTGNSVAATTYTTMSKPQLIDQCKAKNIVGYSHKTKMQMIECLNEHDNRITHI